MEELGKKNGDLSFLIGLFGVLDYRISEVNIVLSSFKVELKNDDVKKIKEFIDGSREITPNEVFVLMRKCPQFGL